ncbi:iron-containing alcohol dehydrogenase [Clostridium estertheticum]|uniref:iron-containing alcohol dehydrogenase n=1 Tax=Clostridium estertheticum TaxID=238834 RepID=UPI001CF0DDAF|nr:iron-containing alcohol dehydrogenase [Clostridium estertheticum]MCB2354608.1 iron-containing alcohol dehydrogenase [Clostridium estertheticum]WAG40856.1 iron-containing alcohol dehydrogenase [Clostridium estertheticum]
MNNFVYHNTTKVYFGNNQISHLGEEIKKYGSHVLMVYGGGSIKKNGIYDNVMKVLKDADIQVTEFGGVEPNPQNTTVNRGTEVCRNNDIDVVLAVGGGSTIDASKVIAQAAFYDGDCWDLVTGKIKTDKALPIFTVVTIAAAGSETDAWAVVSNADINDKIGPNSPFYQPKVSFLNPINTFTVSAYQTAAGSADILSHITDCRYFIPEKKMEFVSEMMEVMAKSVIKYAPMAIAEPDNYEARENLLWISSMITSGIMDIGSKADMIMHMMEHEISAYYDINHGHGIAILMPHWMEYVLNEKTAPVFYRFGVKCLDIDPYLFDIDGAKQTIEALRDWFFNKLKLQSKLSDLGVDDKNFHAMAVKACNEGTNGMLCGLTSLTAQDLENIYRLSL